MRKFYQLTDKDGANRRAIPRTNEREVLTTPFKTGLVTAIGSDGRYDVHGDSKAPMDAGRARLEFDIVRSCTREAQVAVDRMLAAMEGSTRQRGIRKLYRWEETNGINRRWSLARLTARPPLPRDWLTGRHLTMRADFLLPDPKFYESLRAKYLTDLGFTATTLIDAVVPEDIAPDFVFREIDISASPTVFTLTNRGDLVSQHVIFRLRSDAAPGFTNPAIANATTGQSFSSPTDGSTAATILSFWAAPGLGKVQLSLDSGGTWTDDTVNLSLGADQAVLMELAPGDNVFSYTDGGAPNATLFAWYLHAFRE